MTPTRELLLATGMNLVNHVRGDYPEPDHDHGSRHRSSRKGRGGGGGDDEGGYSHHEQKVPLSAAKGSGRTRQRHRNGGEGVPGAQPPPPAREYGMVPGGRTKVTHVDGYNEYTNYGVAKEEDGGMMGKVMGAVGGMM
jgi:hypothetical protein